MTRLNEAQRAELEALRRSYQAELPDKLELITGAVEALLDGGWNKPDLQALYLIVHKVTGSAAIYGFDAISRAAGELETWMLAFADGGVPEPRRGELLPLVRALEDALRNPSR